MTADFFVSFSGDFSFSLRVWCEKKIAKVKLEASTVEHTIDRNLRELCMRFANGKATSRPFRRAAGSSASLFPIERFCTAAAILIELRLLPGRSGGVASREQYVKSRTVLI